MSLAPRLTLRVGPALCAAVCALACASVGESGVYYARGESAVTSGGLQRARWRAFRTTFLKPGARLSRYDKILLDPVLPISYARPPRRYRLEDSTVGNWALPASDLETMKQLFLEIFSATLGAHADFTLVTQPGPDVLRVSGHLVDLKIKIAPWQDRPPDSFVLSSSPGALTLWLDVRDSRTGSLLVRVGERRSIGLIGNGIANATVRNPVSNSLAVRELFRGWAQRLHRELDELRALPAVPRLRRAPHGIEPVHLAGMGHEPEERLPARIPRGSEPNGHEVPSEGCEASPEGLCGALP